MNEGRMEKIYIANKRKLLHKALRVSQRQIHTVHTCKLSQAKNYQPIALPPTYRLTARPNRRITQDIDPDDILNTCNHSFPKVQLTVFGSAWMNSSLVSCTFSKYFNKLLDSGTYPLRQTFVQNTTIQL